MRLVLYTRAGCHLCERLAALIEPDAQELVARGAEFSTIDIDSEVNWRPLYDQRVPVLVADGEVILEGKPSIEAVGRAMAALRG